MGLSGRGSRSVSVSLAQIGHWENNTTSRWLNAVLSPRVLHIHFITQHRTGLSSLSTQLTLTARGAGGCLGSAGSPFVAAHMRRCRVRDGARRNRLQRVVKLEKNIWFRRKRTAARRAKAKFRKLAPQLLQA